MEELNKGKVVPQLQFLTVVYISHLRLKLDK